MKIKDLLEWNVIARKLKEARNEIVAAVPYLIQYLSQMRSATR